MSSERYSTMEATHDNKCDSASEQNGDNYNYEEAESNDIDTTDNIPEEQYEDPSCTNQYDSVPSEGFPCGPAPPIEVKLFAGRVPKTMLEDDLRPIFEAYGPVSEIVIIRDRVSNLHKGSAFIKMVCLSQADEAIKEMHGTKVLDPSTGPLQLKYATGEIERLGFPASSMDGNTPQGKLFVGSLPKDTNEEEIKTYFEPYGTVEDIYIMKDNGVCKGCAFVKYAYKEQAAYACKCLDQKMTFSRGPRPLEVRFAESKSQKTDTGSSSSSRMGNNMYSGSMSSSGGSRSSGRWKEYFNHDGRPYYHNEITNITQWDRPMDFDQIRNKVLGGPDITGPPGSNIFVFHIPNEWTENDLCGAFSKFGTIISARIATERGRNRGYGFVSYNNVPSAARAVNEMNGFMAYGKRLKVTPKKGEEDYIRTSGPVGGGGGGMPLSPGMGGSPGMGMDSMGPGMYSSQNPMMNQYGMPPGGAPYGPYSGGYSANRYAPY